MPHEMVGFKELKSFNEKKREMFKHSDDITTQHINAAVERRKRIAVMTPTEIGKLQACAYAKSLYLSGMSW